MVATLLLSPLIWAQQGPRPNVIFIYSDDQGYADRGIWGRMICIRRIWIAWLGRECDLPRPM